MVVQLKEGRMDMKLSQLFSGEVRNGNGASRASQPTPAQIEQVNRQVRSLVPGQTISGEIVGRNGSEVQIRLSEDVVLNARVDRNLNLEVGKNMTFEVKNNGSSLTLSPLFTNVATDVNVLKALDMAGLPVNRISVDMTEQMMAAGMNVSRNSLQRIFREINHFPQSEVSDIINLHKLQIPVNEGNVNQMISYRNLNHQLGQGMDAILGALPEVFDSMAAKGDMEGAVRLYQEVLHLVQEGGEASPSGTLSAGQGTGLPSGQAVPGEGTLLGQPVPGEVGTGQEAGDRSGISSGQAFMGADAVLTEGGVLQGMQTASGEVLGDTGQSLYTVIDSSLSRQEAAEAAGTISGQEGAENTGAVPGQEGAEGEGALSGMETSRITGNTTDGESLKLAGEASGREMVGSGKEVSGRTMPGIPDSEVQGEVPGRGSAAVAEREGGILKRTVVSEEGTKAGLPETAGQGSGTGEEARVRDFGADARAGVFDRGAVMEETADPAMRAEAAREALALFRGLDTSSGELSFLRSQIVQYARGEITTGQFFSILDSFARGTEGASASMHVWTKLFSGSKFRNLLSEQLKNNWMLRPEEVASPGKVEEMYRRLDRQLKSLGSALENAGQTESTAYRAVTSMSQNVDFLQQLNQMYTYVQLPLHMQQRDGHGELYVYTNKKKLTEKDGTVSALLHLDMDYLGPVDVHVSMKNSKVSTRFYLRDDEIIDFMSVHMDVLTKRLQKRGYDCTCSLVLREKAAGEATRGGLEPVLRQNKGMMLSHYAFDVRT